MGVRQYEQACFWVKNQYLCRFLQGYLAMGELFFVEVLRCEQGKTLLRCYLPQDGETLI